jgi:hypothetical protein
MKKTILCLMIGLLSVGLLTGCAMVAAPVNGGLFTSLTAPITATDNAASSKVGSASCTSILGLIATGDCGISAAARNGNITKIHHVDHSATSVLGIFSSFETHVYGE